MGGSNSTPAPEVASSRHELPPDSRAPEESLKDRSSLVQHQSQTAPSRPSYCKDYGKDKVIFLNREDWDRPPTTISTDFIQSLGEPEEGVPRGVILPNGDINWGCPCLGNLAYGPCALPFREAFSCFHYSLADPKGSDCIDYFRDMTMCMAKYPRLYPQDDDDDDEEDAFAAMDKAEQQAEMEKRSQARRAERRPAPLEKKQE